MNSSRYIRVSFRIKRMWQDLLQRLQCELQTKRQLKTRIAEHRNHIRWNTTTHSIITDYRLEEDHKFDWKNVTVSDEEPQYRKRLVSEMLYIRRQTCGLNLQIDLERLPKTYFSIVDGLNIGALLLPANQCTFFVTLRLNY